MPQGTHVYYPKDYYRKVGYEMSETTESLISRDALGRWRRERFNEKIGNNICEESNFKNLKLNNLRSAFIRAKSGQNSTLSNSKYSGNSYNYRKINSISGSSLRGDLT